MSDKIYKGMRNGQGRNHGKKFQEPSPIKPNHKGHQKLLWRIKAWEKTGKGPDQGWTKPGSMKIPC